MVSVFEGQLTRTWFYELENKKHVLNLYHDTISGVRSAMLDYQEIRGSLGNSSIMMDSKGHRIFFQIGNHPGYIEIKNSWFSGFQYACVINDREIKEVTQGVPENQDLIFRPKVLDTTFTADEFSDYPVAWYVLQTTRITDNVTTTVHRRFREFVELNSQIKQNMKGHHLRDVLPQMPEKPSKQFTDHRDPAFIQDRCFKLERFVVAMTSIPHVANMVCMKAFLGIMDQVKEYSLTFHVPTLGMTLLPTDRQGESGVTPCVVGMIQKPDVCKGVLPGDSVSRVNGVPLAGSTFNAAISRIKTLPRPLIIHFIQVVVVDRQRRAVVDQDRIQVHGIHHSSNDGNSNSNHAQNSTQGHHQGANSSNISGNILDEVATVVAAEEKLSAQSALFQGDTEPEEEEGVWQEDYDGAEQEAEEVVGEVEGEWEGGETAAFVREEQSAQIAEAERETTISPVLDPSVPVEFVDVEIVEDAPAPNPEPTKAAPTKAAPGKAAPKATTAAPARASPTVASRSATASPTAAAAGATTTSTATASPHKNVSFGAHAQPSAAAPVRTAHPSVGHASAAAKAPPGTHSASKPAAAASVDAAPIPVTIVPVEAPAVAKAISTPGGVKARVAAMNKDSPPQASSSTARSPTNSATTVPAVAAPSPQQTATVARTSSFSRGPVPVAASKPPAAVAVPVIKNRAVFEDTPTATSPNSSAKSTTPTSSNGKNPLFKDEVVGFGVVPAASVATKPAAAVSNTKSKSAQAPAAAPTQAQAPAVKSTTAAPASAAKASSESSDLKTPFGNPAGKAVAGPDSSAVPATTTEADSQQARKRTTSFGKTSTVKPAAPAPVSNALLGWD